METLNFLEIYNRITHLAKEKGMTLNDLKTIGISPQIFTRMKTVPPSIPSVDKIYCIAQYFDTSVEYILTGKEYDSGMLSPEEYSLLTNYKKLVAMSPKTADEIRKTVQKVVDTPQKDEEAMKTGSGIGVGLALAGIGAAIGIITSLLVTNEDRDESDACQT